MLLCLGIALVGLVIAVQFKPEEPLWVVGFMGVSYLIVFGIFLAQRIRAFTPVPKSERQQVRKDGLEFCLRGLAIIGGSIAVFAYFDAPKASVYSIGGIVVGVVIVVKGYIQILTGRKYE